MARYIKVSALGPAPHEMDPEKDPDLCVQEMIEHWDAQLGSVLPDRPDLIVLPEACDRPPNFPMRLRQRYYEVRGDRIRDHFIEVASAYGCNIAYSSARLLPDGTYRNSTQFISRDGGIDGIYDKNHLVVTEHTEGRILFGRDAPVIRTDFGTVGGAICFDLNFDELRLRYAESRPELIVFSSMYHGGLMQSYWAYSCRSYFIGAVAGLPCSVISPLGTLLAASTNYTKHVTTTINLDYAVAHLDFNREKLSTLKRKYGPGVTITDPGYLGSVLITSETSEATAADMVAEFGIELLDDYFRRSSSMRAKAIAAQSGR
jgi:predicted amidohydrolase